MIARLALVMIAATALAWQVIGVREVHLENAGTHAAAASLRGDTSGLAQAHELLRRAGALSLDREPEFRELQILSSLDRRREALALARRLAGHERDNVMAWITIARLARDQDPALAAQAQARVRALKPAVR